MKLNFTFGLLAVKIIIQFLLVQLNFIWPESTLLIFVILSQKIWRVNYSCWLTLFSLGKKKKKATQQNCNELHTHFLIYHSYILRQIHFCDLVNRMYGMQSYFCIIRKLLGWCYETPCQLIFCLLRTTQVCGGTFSLYL